MAKLKYNAILLNRYYDQRGKSESSIHPFFKLDKIQWSSQKISQEKGGISGDTNNVTDIFLTNDGVFSYVNGDVFIKATLPFGYTKTSGDKSLNSIGILDGKGGLVAIVALSETMAVMAGREIDIVIQLSTRDM